MLLATYSGEEMKGVYPVKEETMRITPFLFFATSARIAIRVVFRTCPMFIESSLYEEVSVSSHQFERKLFRKSKRKLLVENEGGILTGSKMAAPRTFL